MTVLLANNKASRDSVAPAPSVKKNGELYTWRMFFENNSSIIDADLLSDLLEVFIPGYSDKNEQDKAIARIIYAEQVAFALRVSIYSSLDSEQVNNLELWERAVLQQGKGPIHGWGSLNTKESQTEIDIWKSKIPLVLVDAFYAPYSDILRPVSSLGDYDMVDNIIWLNASEEYELLLSLQRIGLITFGHPSSKNRQLQRRDR